MRGRGWAYAGAVLGGAVSVAANVAHSYVRPDEGWPDGHTGPEVGAVAAAVFWPVALLVAVEILARVEWPAGWRWTSVRFGGLLPVALVAAFVSYRHLSGLLTHYGEDGVTSLVGPLAVDGLMVLATAALLATGNPAVVQEAATEQPAEVPVQVPTEQDVPAVHPVRPAPLPAALTGTAAAVAALVEADPDLPVAEIARRVGKSRTTVTRHLQRLSPAT